MLLCTTQPAFAQRIALIDNGRANSVIILAADAHEDEQQAARELQEHLQKISGVQLEIRSVAPAALAQTAQQITAQRQVPILLGEAALAIGLQQQINIPIGQTVAFGDLRNRIRAKGTDPASFAINISNNRVQVAGLSPESTLFGVYELLEQLGVRWFMPGELGMVIPALNTVALSAQDTIQIPSFNGRWNNAGRNFAEWGRRMRLGGPYFPSAHGVPGIKNSDLAQQPEYFALVNGKRVTRQINVSNSEVIRVVTEGTKAYFRKNPNALWIGMGPNDGGVDEKAKVWVNGQLIGISHGCAFLPFEMDATPAIRAEEHNVVTVRLINARVDELGTGGITAPVMFYAPAAGKDAQLENVRDLTPTFP